MTRRVSSWKATLLWALIVTSIIILTVLHQQQLTWKPSYIDNHQYIGYDLDREEPVDTDQACKFPRLHPFDPSILGYLSAARTITCKDRQPMLTYIDVDGVLRFNGTALKLAGYEASKLACEYQEIHRRSDNEVAYRPRQKLHVNGSKLYSDFVYVYCDNFAGISFYSNIHCHVVPSATYKSSSGKLPYNVLIVGIDSLSRLSYIRHLPKTYSYLTKQLKAFVFRGMTKVGDNTFPNLGAILTGKSVFDDELPHVEKGEPYDVWPCVWKNFSQHGYATLFAEDRPEIALFNYLRGGFVRQPTDHYMRPFWLTVEASKLHRMSSHMCFGNIPKHLLQLNYTRDFAVKYSDAKRPYFGFSFLVELSHDYVKQVYSADKDIEALLRDLHNRNYLNRTFFIFLSDHGHRFDPMRATLVGRIEERMPFFSIVVPPEIRKTQPQVISRLNTNTGRLVSPYDIYYTILDILSHSVNKTDLGTVTSPRGTSLFGPISPNRTCEAAGIPDHYCTCEVEKSLDTSDHRSKSAAVQLVATINDMLEFRYGNLSLCAKLTLDEILSADQIVPSREVIVNSRIYFGRLVEDSRPWGMLTKLRVIVRTVPGAALFEATLLHREDEDSMEVLGDVSRINRYGTQSWCIHDATLRKYCYCLEQKP